MLICFLKSYWKTLLCAAGIAFLSLYTFQPSDLPRIINGDKWVHAAMYAVLTLALFWDLRPCKSKVIVWCVLLLVPTLYGGLIEILQNYCTTTRTGDWIDWATDILGSWLTLLVITICYKLKVHER